MAGPEVVPRNIPSGAQFELKFPWGKDGDRSWDPLGLRFMNSVEILEEHSLESEGNLQKGRLLAPGRFAGIMPTV